MSKNVGWYPTETDVARETASNAGTIDKGKEEKATRAVEVGQVGHLVTTKIETVKPSNRHDKN